jgi:hypothetical protein
MAALSICEALLLALNDAKILPEDEIMGVLGDAASAMATLTWKSKCTEAPLR